MERDIRKLIRGALIPAAGVLFLAAYYLPYLILGENSHIFIWDILDSEIIFNRLSAKYFFDFSGAVPELMNVDVRTINAFSIFQIIFYMFLRPFSAYIVNDMVVRATACAGMYLFMRLMVGRRQRFACITISLLFAGIPFFTTYGLTVAGLPLLIWAFWKIYRREKLPAAYLSVVYYTVSSSLMLTGYFIVALLAVLCVMFLVKKRLRREQIHFFIAAFLMAALYILSNLKIISLMMEGYVSHRELWNEPIGRIPNVPGMGVLEFLGEFLILLSFGHLHMRSYHSLIFIICIAALILGIKTYRKRKSESAYSDNEYFEAEFAGTAAFRAEYFGSAYFRCWRALITTLILSVIIAFTSAFLQTAVVASMLSRLGLNIFNFSRIFHLLTLTWYASGGFALVIVQMTLEKRLGKLFAKTSVIVFAVACFCFMNMLVLDLNGNVEPYMANVYALFGYKSENSPTYKQFYDEELFAEIAGYIGLPKESYRVGAIGMHPSALIYNGFHTVDGYVQNYSLEYWYKFRKIIAPELDKSQELSDYFIWGNRCYLFTVPTGYKYHYSKYSDVTVDALDYDLQAFHALEGRYILSAVPILCFNGVPVGESGELLFHRTFEHDGSWWSIYLYEAA